MLEVKKHNMIRCDVMPTNFQNALGTFPLCYIMHLIRVGGGIRVVKQNIFVPTAERDPFHNLPENAVCVPGSRWKNECNWCSCGENGIAACTLKACIPGEL